MANLRDHRPVNSPGASRSPRAIPFGKYLLLERLHSGLDAEVFLALKNAWIHGNFMT